MAARTRRSLLALMVAAVAGLAALMGLPSSAVAAASTGDVYIIQGIVGSTVDMYVDDNRVQSGAAAKFILGPLRLAPGDHVVTLKENDATLVSAKFSVTAGSSIDVVAHRSSDADRKPVVTVFNNDLRPIAPGKARLVVAHVAVAPSIDVRIDGAPLLRNIAPGESLLLELPSGSISVEVTPVATEGDPLIPATTISLADGTLVRTFLIGDSSDATTDGVIQYIKLNVVGSSRPTKVQTGDGGQAAGMFDGYGSTLATWGFVGAVLALGGVTFLNRRHAANLMVGSRHSR